MKVVMDIDDAVFEEMQLSSEIKREPLEQILSDLFLRYIHVPTKVIHAAYDADIADVERFEKLLYQYLTRAIEGIGEGSIDRAMKEVFMRIRDSIVDQDHVLAELYRNFNQNC